MKKGFLYGAGGLVLASLLLTQTGFFESSANEQTSNDDSKVTINISPAVKGELKRGCDFYSTLLNGVDKIHFSGTSTVSQKDMAKGGYQGILSGVYNNKFYDPIKNKYDESVVTFMDPAKKKKIKSLTIDGATFTMKDPSSSLSSYSDHCGYFQEDMVSLSDKAGISISELYEYALKGALASSRDPHTMYDSKEEAEKMRASSSGKFGGLGVGVALENGFIKIAKPSEGNPAAKAGLKDGDLITHLDGVSVLGKTINEAVTIIRGDVGEDITLTIKRGDQEPFDVTITRAIIKIQAVSGQLIGKNKDTAHIRVKTFGNNTTSELISTIKDLIKKAAQNHVALKNIFVDFRNNPGGLLTQAISVSDVFLQAEKGKKNVIVATGKTANDHKVLVDSVIEGAISGVRVILLQNNYSASASEIVAGALKDAGIEVVGTTSFGKGTVQSVIQLPDGSSIRITIAAFFPGNSGLSNQGSGIIPNTNVVFNDIRDEIVAKALRESSFARAIINPELTRAGILPERTCRLKKEFAGTLSEEELKTIPEGLVFDARLKNEATGEFEPAKMLDAEVACALKRVEGVSPYVDITAYKAPLKPIIVPKP